jgi:hypothetical protein
MEKSNKKNITSTNTNNNNIKITTKIVEKSQVNKIQNNSLNSVKSKITTTTKSTIIKPSININKPVTKKENIPASKKNKEEEIKTTSSISKNITSEENTKISQSQDHSHLNSALANLIPQWKKLFKNESLIKHLDSIPEESVSSYQSLAKYLVSIFTEEIEKFAVIYMWICQNISYDITNYKTMKSDCSPEGVFKNRIAVCSGYAWLFSAMCKEVGLVSVDVQGYAKGYGYTPGQKFPSTNHEWNAIKLGEEYHLVDCCWGSGTVNEENIFNKRFTPYYFMTPPMMFLNDHLPSDSKWQLSNNKIDLKQYEKNTCKQLASFVSAYYNGIFQPITHNYPEIICANNNLSLKINVPQQDIMLDLKLNGKELPGMTFLSYDEDNDFYCLEILLPGKDNYELLIYGKKLTDESKSYTSILKYFINCTCSSKLGKNAGFPYVFDPKGSFIISPMKKYLKIGDVENFKLKLKNAGDVAIIQDKQWTHLKKNEEGFWEGSVKITCKKISVFSKEGGGNDYCGRVNYEGI